jgi:tetratricopeptide (TPR) repeat protein
MNHYHRAWYLLLRGRNDEAIAEHELARRLDPLTPLHTVWLPGVYLLAGRREEALVRARDVVTRYPDNATALYVLGLAALARGEPDEALAAHEKATAINPIWSFALGRTCALTGRVDEARTILAQLEAQPRTSFGAYTLAALHTALGNRDEAFRWLAYEPPHAWLPWVGLMLEFEPLREDPRFAEVRQRLRFPDAQEQGSH